MALRFFDKRQDVAQEPAKNRFSLSYYRPKFFDSSKKEEAARHESQQDKRVQVVNIAHQITTAHEKNDFEAFSQYIKQLKDVGKQGDTLAQDVHSKIVCHYKPAADKIVPPEFPERNKHLLEVTIREYEFRKTPNPPTLTELEPTDNTQYSSSPSP